MYIADILIQSKNMRSLLTKVKIHQKKAVS